MRCRFYGNEMKKTRAEDFSRVTQIIAFLFPLDSVHRILTVSSSSPRNQASNSENPLNLMIPAHSCLLHVDHFWESALIFVSLRKFQNAQLTLNKAVIRSWIILRDAKLLSVAANLAGNGYLSCNLLTWGIGEAFCCNKIGWFAALLCSYARKFQYFASKQLPTKRLVGKPSGNYV